MQNVDFLEFLRTFLLWSKKHSFLSRISKKVSFWLFLLKKKNIWEKGRFFDKNHRLTPWQNVHFFFTLQRLQFSGLKSVLFYPEYQTMFLSGLFCKKKKEKKRLILGQKQWTNPFAKCRFFSTLWELHFLGLKTIIFYPEYQKMFLSGSFC